MQTNKALVNFVRLYEAAEELIGTEFVEECFQDWLMDGEEINLIVSLLRENK